MTQNVISCVKVLARHMNGLSSEELAKLDQPLHSMLLSVLPPGPMDRWGAHCTVMCAHFINYSLLSLSPFIVRWWTAQSCSFSQQCQVSAQSRAVSLTSPLSQDCNRWLALHTVILILPVNTHRAVAIEPQHSTIHYHYCNACTCHVIILFSSSLLLYWALELSVSELRGGAVLRTCAPAHRFLVVQRQDNGPMDSW